MDGFNKEELLKLMKRLEPTQTVAYPKHMKPHLEKEFGITMYDGVIYNGFKWYGSDYVKCIYVYDTQM